MKNYGKVNKIKEISNFCMQKRCTFAALWQKALKQRKF